MYKRKHKIRVRESVIVIFAIHRWTRVHDEEVYKYRFFD